jgi:putative component of membrane protein insertase Oxa1/YidC/SpoIIIJ protein YidD
MQARPLDTLTRTTASLLISGYQKYLSPLKGFSCAHRVWHRGESCSQYTKRTIVDRGLVAAIPLVRKRFGDCKIANERVKLWRLQQRTTCDRQRVMSLSDSWAQIDRFAQEGESDEERERQERKLKDLSSPNSCFLNEFDCCADCANLGNYDCHACHALHLPAIDCAAIDCAGLDCGALDCSGLDCGGCDGCSGLDCSGCSW